MKEFQDVAKDKLQVSADVPVKKEFKLIGSLKVKNGHTCFQLNLLSGEITVAVFEKTATWSGVKSKLVASDNCIYDTFLNMTNAKRGFIKQMAGIKSLITI